MMRNFFIAFIACISFTIRAQYEALSSNINQWANDIELSQAQIGIAFHDVQLGYMIAGYNHNKFMIPASSLKVLPSLLLVKEIGPDYKFPTVLGYEGNIVDSVLYGNIYIIGSGDPSLASKRFDDKPSLSQLVSFLNYKIKNAGIKGIHGDLIADQSIFESYPICPTWEWGDLGLGFASGAWGLNVRENEYDIYLDQSLGLGGATSIAKTNPEIPGLNLINETYTIAEGNDEKAHVFGGPYTYTKRIVGSVPMRKTFYKIEGSIPDPPKLLVDLLGKSLNENGISYINTRVVTSGITRPQIITIDTIFSKPLKDIIAIGNYQSINMYAESFLKLLGVKKMGRGAGSEGLAAILNYFNQRGIITEGINLEDGSGLSARNLISPYHLSAFLSTYANENGIENIKPYLPMAGKEGTVSRMLTKSPAKGNVWMKSGTLNRVVSYTGILLSKTGRWYTFSIIVNNHTISNNAVRIKIANLLENAFLNL